MESSLVFKNVMGHFVLFLVLLITVEATACKYNIRDVGFVDLGSDRYRLFGYVGSNASSELREGLAGVGQEVLANSNIDFELVPNQGQADSPARELLNQLQIETFPVAVLRVKDRNPLVVSLPTNHDQMVATFATLTSSPVRDTLLKKLKDVYAMVLVVHGVDNRQNTLARDAAQSAIRDITQVMGMMPKASGESPQLLELPFAARAQERVLLWSLGIEEKNPAPAAVIIYGRARILGKVLHGKDITAQTLKRFLSIIGLDCECGLDRRWMTGRRLPVTWDQTTRQQVARALNFDPDSPMIKMEISRILMKRPPGSGQTDWTQFSGPSLGYQEFKISPTPKPQETEVQDSAPDEREEIEEPPSLPAPVVNPPESPPGKSGLGPLSGLNILILVAAAVIILGIGITIALRKKENA